MIFDHAALERVDFPRIRDRVVAATATERGRRYATQLEPIADFDRIVCEQAITAEVRDLVQSVDLHALPTVDTAELTHRAAIGMVLAPLELRRIADALAAAAAACNAAGDRRDGSLAGILGPYRPLPEVQRAVTAAINERGQVNDRASAALSRVRRSLAQAQDEARERVHSMLRSKAISNAIQDFVVTMRDGRYVIPIKAQHSSEVPGIVHDTSSSGQTLFVEPLAALEINNRVRTLALEEQREVQRILAALCELCGRHADQIEANVDVLAQLDLRIAKARAALAMHASQPHLADRPALRLQAGRHPLLGDRAVPQSFALDEETRLLVISGPNMGGKTVALKMVGLFIAMAYAGLQLPAGEETTVGRFAEVFVDIGDEQSIAEDTSTFSAHLRNMRRILERADAASLILIDEIGGGTEPAGGAALAVAMLERLLAIGAKGIVTTHATEVKLFAHEASGVTNAGVRFDPKTFAPTYELDVGAPGQSLAFPLARSLGIPPALVSRAESLLDSHEQDYERALRDLTQAGAQLRREKQEVERERIHLEQLQANVRSRTAALESERRALAAKAEAQLQQTLRDFSVELAARAESPGRARITPGQSALLQRTLEEIRRDLDVEVAAEAAPGPQAFSANERVRVLSLNQDATVVADNGESLLLAIGPMKTTAQKSDVRRIAEPVRSGARRDTGSERTLDAVSRASVELDVRGKRYVEAEPLVDRWIDEAVLVSASPLRLIHGKGTGMLGRGLQAYLREHSRIKSVRYGNEDEGGSGVTILELR